MPAEKTVERKQSKEKGTSRKTDGLRTPQVRILKALSKAKAPGWMSKVKISEVCAKAGFKTAEKFVQWIADPLGSSNPQTRLTAEIRCGYKSLLSLELVRSKEIDVNGKTERVYQITASGRKALQNAEKE